MLTLQIPTHVQSPAQLREWEWDVLDRGPHQRDRHPYDDDHAGVLLPFIELPDEFADAEHRIITRDPTFTEVEYQQVIAKLSTFDRASYVAVGSHERRKTVMERPDDPATRARYKHRLTGHFQPVPTVIVGISLMCSSTPHCVPVPDKASPFVTEAECEASCPPIDPCCAGTTIPSTLYARFTGVLSSLSPLTLTSTGLDSWASGFVDPCGLGSTTFVFQCVGDAGFQLIDVEVGPNLFGAINLPTSCDPFEWSGTQVGAGGGSCGTGTVTATVTPT